MQLVLPFEHMAKAAQYMEPSVFEYVREGEIESFESFEKFDFLAFDWYDVHSERTEDYKMLAYVSRENLIIFTEGAAGDTAKKIMDGLAAENPELRSEQLLYRFFVRLLNGDMDCLSRLENEIDEYENVYLFKSESGKDVFEKLANAIYFGTRSLSWNGIQFLSHFLRSREESSYRNTRRRNLSMSGTSYCQGSRTDYQPDK